ncbi:MAG: hypothetical protein LBF60_06205 [Treponema sp.]|jgi:hypothetical protein|nr:hypothetical protein [Treponema sp.]
MKIRAMAGVLVAFLFFSCDQSPIFYAIYQEVKPKDPRVKGNPTNMAELHEIMYVASRFGKSVHRYNKEGAWIAAIPSPGGRNLMELVTDGKSLYALAGDPLGKTEVYVKNDDDAWNVEPIRFDASGVIQTICGAGDANGGYLFASTEEGLFSYQTGAESFSSESLLSGLSKEDIVKGAAYMDGIYYVAVVNKGVYTFDGGLSGEPVDGTAGKPIVGIRAVGDRIVAVSRRPSAGDGSLFYGDSSGFTEVNKSIAFSGSMEIWRNPDNPAQSLLLVGIQSQSYSTINGYREIPLGDDESLDANSLDLRTPGVSDVSTVSSADRYTSTMGLRIATSLYQAPDNTLFASTMKNGLWSYRNDVWNAEE